MRDILRTFLIYTAKALFAVLIFTGIVAIFVYGIQKGGAIGLAIVLLASAILIGAATTLAKYRP